MKDKKRKRGQRIFINKVELSKNFQGEEKLSFEL
jgi:hypothetical protein